MSEVRADATSAAVASAWLRNPKREGKPPLPAWCGGLDAEALAAEQEYAGDLEEAAWRECAVVDQSQP
jgi:hypothetical protein